MATKSYFIQTVAHGAHPGTTGGGCPCHARAKLELRGEGLDFLAGFGFSEVDSMPGSCSLCGRVIPFRRLTISAVEDLREAQNG